MALGIILHTANIYGLNIDWRIGNQERSLLVYFIRETIHLFRMPTFFMVSGFFCFMTLEKYGASLFVKVRMKRIAIPLITTALTLNSIQALVLYQTGWQVFEFSDYWLEGNWISHLWFLINLIVYFAIAVSLYSIFSTKLSSALNLLSTWLLKLPIAIVILLAASSGIAIVGSPPLGFPLYSYYLFDILNMYSLATYVPYFFFGAMLFTNSELLNRFTSVSNWILVIFVVVSQVTLYLIAPLVPGMAGQILIVFSSSVASWTMAAVLFKVFLTYFNKKSDFWLSLSSSSYTIYLFHHLIVIVLGLVAIELGLSPFWGMTIIICSTVMITLGIHHYIVNKSDFLKLIFNGK